MKNDPRKPRVRRSIRLKEHDYASPSAYFVTMVTRERECLFGEIVAEVMQLNDYGRIVETCWHTVAEHFACVKLGAHVVMPNHVHGIIQIVNEERWGEVLSPRREVIAPRTERTIEDSDGGTPPLRKPTLGQIVGYFKYQSTKKMNLLDGSGVITKFWQRNYYEHIIRNDDDWDRIQHYIESNPSRWIADDKDNVPPA